MVIKGKIRTYHTIIHVEDLLLFGHTKLQMKKRIFHVQNIFAFLFALHTTAPLLSFVFCLDLLSFINSV